MAYLCVAAFDGFGASLQQPLIYVEAPALKLDGPERFPNGATLKIATAGQSRVLVNGFAATADACVSFDGRRVLFAGKQSAGQRWQIWEMPISGGVPRQVTNTSDDSIRPFYLPADKFVYARRANGAFHLEILTFDGKVANRLSYAPGDQTPTDVLRDGRILFEARRPDGARELYTVYTDGTGVEAHRCDHRGDRVNGRELSNGDIIFETGGKLARFTSARATELPVEQPAGEFTGPIAELDANEIIASYRAKPGEPFGLVRWKIGAAPVPLLSAKAASLLQPVVVRARPAPKWHPSAIGERPGANLLCLNVYTSKERIAAGTVARVRLWTRDDAGMPAKLGEASVENDGSFYVMAPGEKPLRFELLNKAGAVVSAEKGWWWARTGEQRVCVGCHAGPERAPENRRPQILVHSTEPAKLFGGRQ